MGRAYSADLRERVLRAHERGEGSQRVLAERFGVATGTVGLWLAAARDEGRRGPKPHGGGRKALGGADPMVLAALVGEANDLSLAAYAARRAERAGVRPRCAAPWHGWDCVAKKGPARERAGAQRRRSRP